MRLKKDKYKADLLGTYVSKHPQDYEGDDYLVTEAVEELVLTTEGIVGDRHYGYLRDSDTRVKHLYKKGIPVRNNRQWLGISSSEIWQMAKTLSTPDLTPELLGVNLLIDGVGDLSELPPLTHLIFSPFNIFEAGRDEDVVLVSYCQALPCTVAGKALAKPFNDASLETRFPKAALGYRGLLGWVQKGGTVRPGYTVHVMFPTGKG